VGKDLKAQIRTALGEFGPCTVRDLYDYLRSDLAVTRGLLRSNGLSKNRIYQELNNIIKEDESIVKFQCDDSIFRFGVTQYPQYLHSEPHFLSLKAKLRTCIDCAQQIMECDDLSFHFPARCDKYEPQHYFKILPLKDVRAIISDDFTYGVMEKNYIFSLRWPKESELWVINELARKLGHIPPSRLLPLKTHESIANP
jgi:hypothetical protein